ncbi:MAG: adenylosuccinate synthetase [Patescibacteria group bacterium]
MEKLEKMLNGVNTIAVTCRQFGDTGKGKFVDIFAAWADIIVRGTGGDNAGHSICFDGNELVVHVIPSGIMYDSLGKINIIGSGVVAYPKSIISELALLKEKGLSYNNLRIAHNAKLILPTEIVLDRVRESISGKGKIGSTGKGIGPAYADFIDRQGLTINDLLNHDIFLAKLKRHLEYKKFIFKNYDQEVVKTIMDHGHLENGLYYDSKEIFNLDAIYEKYLDYGLELKEFISDTDAFVKENLGKQKILLEGAQGDLLSIRGGTYPYVTSSDCTISGLAQGAGLKESDVDLSLGIIKGFYMTRVGGGPFPTELGGTESDDWCNGGKANKEIEELFYRFEASEKEKNSEFGQGVALRMVGNEYGATTKRPRRTGWLDLPLLRYVLGFNSPDIILTKLDILSGYEGIKICYAYQYKGPGCYYAGKLIKNGDILKTAIPDAAILKCCYPLYSCFDGWQSSLSDCKEYDQLPANLKDILRFIVNETGINPRIISVGPDRLDTIFI